MPQRMLRARQRLRRGRKKASAVQNAPPRKLRIAKSLPRF
jgi:hypothetical protein